MAAHHWNWWVTSDAGLLARIGIGALIFAALAGWDLAQNGRRATRWREYLFLIAAAGSGIAYGTINDAITACISWEYFYYGKGLEAVLGPNTPPAMTALFSAAIKVGAKAAGSAGLIAGAVLLLANSRSSRTSARSTLVSLSERQLGVYLGGIALATALAGLIMGFAGYLGELSWISVDLGAIVREDLFRPRRFECVYGVHLGSYAGGIVGTLIAVWKIRSERKTKTKTLNAEC